MVNALLKEDSPDKQQKFAGFNGESEEDLRTRMYRDGANPQDYVFSNEMISNDETKSKGSKIDNQQKDESESESEE
jgi:hypothetical protein